MKDLLEVNQSGMLGRRMNRSAALDCEIESKSPVTLEEEKMFVISRRADEVLLMSSPVKRSSVLFFNIL